jgi:hypothetical protein
MSISALVTGSLLLLLLLAWRKRAALRARRHQAEQETRILALLVDHERFHGKPLEQLVQVIGNNYTYGSLDFGQFIVEWKVGTLRVVCWGRAGVCESIAVETRA